jgi:transketolase
MAGAMRQRFVDVAGALLDTSPDLAVLTADLSAEMFAAARARHPSRVVNVGIREQLLIGAAAGMALGGMRPIVHSFAPFLVERPFEQIKLDLVHQGAAAVLVSAGASYDIASGGRTHQSPSDVALLSTLPAWTIHVPGHADEAEAALRGAAAGSGNVYIRLSNQTNPRAYAGGVTTLRRGTRGVVLVVGPLLDAALRATATLDVTVLYTNRIRPFDAAALRAALAPLPDADVVLVEPYLEGTSAGEVSRALPDRPHRLLSIGVPHEELRFYGTSAQHAIAHGLDPAGLHRRIAAFLPPG